MPYSAKIAHHFRAQTTSRSGSLRCILYFDVEYDSASKVNAHAKATVTLSILVVLSRLIRCLLSPYGVSLLSIDIARA